MSYSVVFTEEQLVNLLEKIKDDSKLLKIVTDQKDAIIKEKKCQEDEIKIKVEYEQKIRNKLTEYYELIVSHRNYMDKLLSKFVSVHSAWFFSDLKKIKINLELVDRMNEKEIKIVEENLSNLEEFNKAITKDENYTLCSIIYWKYYSIIQNISRKLTNMKNYLRGHSVIELEDLTFKNDYDELYEKVSDRHEHTKDIASSLRELIYKEELNNYNQQNK